MLTIRVMTSTLPPDVRDVFERFITDRVHDRRLAPAADHLAGDPLLQPRAARRSTSRPGSATRRRPTTRRATRTSRCSSPTRPAPASTTRPAASWSRAPRTVDDRDLDANRERYLARVERKLPATKDMHPPKLMRGMFELVLRAPLRQGPPRARLRLARRRPRRSEPELLDSRLEEVRSGHSEEPVAEPRAARGRRDERGTSGSRSSAAATRHAVLSWVAPDGFPLSARVPVGLDRDAGRIALGADARRAAADRGPRLPHRPLARARLHMAGELPGPRRPRPRRRRLGARPAPAGRRLRAARRGPARGAAAQLRKKSLRFSARRESGLKQRG